MTGVDNPTARGGGFASLFVLRDETLKSPDTAAIVHVSQQSENLVSLAEVITIINYKPPGGAISALA